MQTCFKLSFPATIAAVQQREIYDVFWLMKSAILTSVVCEV